MNTFGNFRKFVQRRVKRISIGNRGWLSLFRGNRQFQISERKSRAATKNLDDVRGCWFLHGNDDRFAVGIRKRYHLVQLDVRSSNESKEGFFEQRTETVFPISLSRDSSKRISLRIQRSQSKFRRRILNRLWYNRRSNPPFLSSLHSLSIFPVQLESDRETIRRTANWFVFIDAFTAPSTIWAIFHTNPSSISRFG